MKRTRVKLPLDWIQAHAQSDLRANLSFFYSLSLSLSLSLFLSLFLYFALSLSLLCNIQRHKRSHNSINHSRLRIRDHSSVHLHSMSLSLFVRWVRALAMKSEWKRRQKSGDEVESESHGRNVYDLWWAKGVSERKGQREKEEKEKERKEMLDAWCLMLDAWCLSIPFVSKEWKCPEWLASHSARSSGGGETTLFFPFYRTFKSNCKE